MCVYSNFTFGYSVVLASACEGLTAVLDDRGNRRNLRRNSASHPFSHVRDFCWFTGQFFLIWSIEIWISVSPMFQRC